MLKMIWNPTRKPVEIDVEAQSNFRHLYWLDAAAATITPADQKGNTASRVIPAQSSVFLYAPPHALPGQQLRPAPVYRNEQPAASLQRWNIQAGNIVVRDTTLFEWTTDPRFRYTADTVNYTSTIQLDKAKGKRYLLDLGTVYFTAGITINGRASDHLLWSPYRTDITELLRNGTNTITIAITGARRNSLIKKANDGDALYRHFTGKPLLPGGMIGPVQLLSCDTH